MKHCPPPQHFEWLAEIATSALGASIALLVVLGGFWLACWAWNKYELHKWFT